MAGGREEGRVWAAGDVQPVALSPPFVVPFCLTVVLSNEPAPLTTARILFTIWSPSIGPFFSLFSLVLIVRAPGSTTVVFGGNFFTGL